MIVSVPLRAPLTPPETGASTKRRPLFSTSAAIYGDNPVVPKVETMFPEPKSPYAITKLDGRLVTGAVK